MWTFIFTTIDNQRRCIRWYLYASWPVCIHLTIFMMETFQLHLKIRSNDEITSECYIISFSSWFFFWFTFVFECVIDIKHSYSTILKAGSFFNCWFEILYDEIECLIISFSLRIVLYAIPSTFQQLQFTNLKSINYLFSNVLYTVGFNWNTWLLTAKLCSNRNGGKIIPSRTGKVSRDSSSSISLNCSKEGKVLLEKRCIHFVGINRNERAKHFNKWYP